MSEKGQKRRTKVLFTLFLMIGGTAFLLWPAMLDLNPATVMAGAPDAALSPAAAPSQHLLPTSETDSILLEKEGDSWELIPRAAYRLAARVLHSKQYDDWQASLSPVDLALGWGMLSEPHIDRWISWNQDNRWYTYQYSAILSVPFPREYVRAHSANVHVIPASENIEAILRELKGNEIVQLDGLLVDVETQRGANKVAFRTSLARDDEGDESCEIMYVERVIKDGVEYR